MKGRGTAKQITNFWQTCWDKYKAVRKQQEHTGGGDGDESRDDAGSGSDTDNEELSISGEKRKRAGKPKNEFSSTVLDKFEQSKIFDMIDKVYVPVSFYFICYSCLCSAQNDESVLRHRDFNSSNAVSDDETPSIKRIKRSASAEDSVGDDVLQQALVGLKSKYKREEERDKAAHALALKKEERERAEYEMRIADLQERK